MYAEITKENLDDILKDLGKAYRKCGGKNMPAELIIVGGAAILANYGFRELSYDIDAIIQASGAIKDAALIVRDKYNLAPNWLNSDFRKTDSYSAKLREHSQYYRTFSNVLKIRTVNPEYLVAMKLRSARLYKHDFSDIAGIIMEEKTKNPAFSKDSIIKAYQDMYGDEPIKEEAYENMNAAFSTTNPEALLKQIQEHETSLNDKAKQFENDYPDVLNEENIDSILRTLDQKQNSQPNPITQSKTLPQDNQTTHMDQIRPDKPKPSRYEQTIAEFGSALEKFKNAKKTDDLSL